METTRTDSPGTVSGLAIQVCDLEGMKAFYKALLGADFRHQRLESVEVWRAVAGGLEITLAPWRSRQDFEEFPIHQLRITVCDLERALAAALDAGGRLFQPPHDKDGAPRAAVRDVDGNTLELVQRAPVAA